jgi:hypothetical protein
LVLASALLGCPGPFDVVPCGQIPADGCPSGRGGTCDDVYCAALYDCIDGSWTEVQHCPGFSQGGGGQGGEGTGAGGEGGCAGVTLEHPDETLGCEPDLQLPDCPAVAAAACRPCDTGCVDFFACTDPGWQVVGFCDEEGHVVVTPP